MSRRKGEVTARINERAFPHIVELEQPPNGFGTVLAEMEAWAREPGIELRRGRRQRRDDQEFARWCFPDEESASAFRDHFGAKNDP